MEDSADAAKRREIEQLRAEAKASVARVDALMASARHYMQRAIDLSTPERIMTDDAISDLRTAYEVAGDLLADVQEARRQAAEDDALVAEKEKPAP